MGKKKTHNFPNTVNNSPFLNICWEQRTTESIHCFRLTFWIPFLEKCTQNGKFCQHNTRTNLNIFLPSKCNVSYFSVLGKCNTVEAHELTRDNVVKATGFY